jgi:hypothetical protein
MKLRKLHISWRAILLASVVSCASLYAQDGIVAQVADGGGWKTVFMLTNVTGVRHRAGISFWNSGGAPLELPMTNVADPSGVPQATPRFIADLAPYGSVVIETTGLGGNTTTGWATFDEDIDSEVATLDFVSLTTIFRQSIPGRPDFEAAAPPAQRWREAVLQFDNTSGYATGLALINASLACGACTTGSAATMVFTIRDTRGDVIAITGIQMQPYEHVSFSIADRFPETRGRRGTIRINLQDAPNGAFGALGLRFNPTGAFTSVQPKAIR